MQNIIAKWKQLNPDFDILYFSDEDVKNFFKTTPYFETSKKLKNGVALADFFRICYIFLDRTLICLCVSFQKPFLFQNQIPDMLSH